MSWVAVAMTAVQGAQALEGMPAPVVLVAANFRQCGYCARFPDVGQREACCRGCGAPLVPVKDPSSAYSRLTDWERAKKKEGGAA